MTVKDLCDKLSLTVLTCGDRLNRETNGCYIGDLLSWVMGRAREDAAWITVMGNINSVAVAKLADLSCIILCEKASLDEDARAQADANGIVILSGEDPAYELALKLYEASKS
ncbi:MAG: hypothetical protein FWG94_00700 [Oscillospiraceae bacterium]|nr:hypothetical protein [Oscillospiraceae bacterium]